MDIAAQIQWAILGLTRQKNRIDDEELKKTVCFHLLLLVWEFNAEWNRLGSLARNDDRLQTTLRVISPAIERIRKWGIGLDRVRNQFLGHARHRDKHGRFVPIKEIFEDPLVPTAFAEMLALGKMADLATQWLLNLYPEEAKACTDWLKSQGIVKSSKGLRTLHEVNQELMDVNEEISERFHETNLRLGNPHTGEFMTD